jgi:hypothetical protein
MSRDESGGKFAKCAAAVTTLSPECTFPPVTVTALGYTQE